MRSPTLYMEVCCIYPLLIYDKLFSQETFHQIQKDMYMWDIAWQKDKNDTVEDRTDVQFDWNRISLQDGLEQWAPRHLSINKFKHPTSFSHGTSRLMTLNHLVALGAWIEVSSSWELPLLYHLHLQTRPKIWEVNYCPYIHEIKSTMKPTLNNHSSFRHSCWDAWFDKILLLL